MAAPDMDVIKDIPGYKVILKAVIKAQIQQLVEQLASHTDEESVILTASVSDGTISHLGSDSGKGFLEEQEDVKTQFLGFCLKRHHKKLQEEKERERQKALAAQAPLAGQFDYGPGPRRHPRMPYHTSPRQPFSPQGGFNVRSRHEPYHIPRPNRRTSFTESGQGPLSSPPGENVAMKTEPSDIDNLEGNDSVNRDDDNTNSSFGASEQSGSKVGENTEDSSEVDPKSVKVEAISESDFELEITGVEPGQSVHQDNWDPNVSMGMNFDPSQGATGTAADMTGQGFNCVTGTKPMFTPVFKSPLHQYVCNMCGKSFRHKCRLREHWKNHMGIRPFVCKICGKAFTLKGNLKKHMSKHVEFQSSEMMMVGGSSMEKDVDMEDGEKGDEEASND